MRTPSDRAPKCIILLTALVFAASLGFPTLPDLETGKLIPEVVCQKNSQFRYALYLPSSYTPGRVWPVIVCFDPAARGELAVARFQGAAELYGYIVAASLDAKNGPLEPLKNAALAVWEDLQARLAIDKGRIYSAGHSGGAHAAVYFPFMIGRKTAGIIACANGLPPQFDAAWLESTGYCGLIGLWDFNYRLMVQAGRDLEKGGVPHLILYYEDWHTWASEEFCRAAVEWMELEAMRKGQVKKNDAFVSSFYDWRLKKAQAWEAKGRLVFTAEDYARIASDFDGLCSVEEVKARAAEVRGREAWSREARAKDKAEQDEERIQQLLIRSFAELAQNEQGSSRWRGAVGRMDLDTLVLRAEDPKDPCQSDMAKRLLAELALNADRVAGQAREARNLERAAAFLELSAQASAAHPLHAQRCYNLACVDSLMKRTKEALKSLRLALDKGFRDWDIIDKDPDLDNIRREKQFQDMVAAYRSGKKSE